MLAPDVVHVTVVPPDVPPDGVAPTRIVTVVPAALQLAG